MGPCEIMRRLTHGKYEVRTPKGYEKLHADSFKPFCEPLNGPSIPVHYYKPPALPSSEETWVVEKKLKHRMRKGVLQWLVKWKGFAKQTWEPAASFIGDFQTDWIEYNKKNNLPVRIADL